MLVGGPPGAAGRVGVQPPPRGQEHLQIGRLYRLTDAGLKGHGPSPARASSLGSPPPVIAPLANAHPRPRVRQPVTPARGDNTGGGVGGDGGGAEYHGRGGESGEITGH